jgi:PilZ domain
MATPIERRQYPRHAVDFEVKIRNLGGEEPSITARVLDVSKSGICVMAPSQLDGLVQLEVADSVLIGHVAYCHEQGSRFRTGIAIEQVRLGTSDLGQLLQSVLLDAMPATPGVLAPDAYLG